MPIQKIYTKTSNPIASYDYTDIEEATGIVDYLGYSSNISGAATYHLGRNSIYSAVVETSIPTNGGTLTFNTSAFNLPRIIRGTAILRVSTCFTANVGNTGWFDFSLYKVSEGVTTLIGNAQVDKVTASSDTITAYVLPMTLPITNMKKGDNLRLIITFYTSNGAGYIGHDPANRDGTKITPAATSPTKMELFIPYKIDT